MRDAVVRADAGGVRVLLLDHGAGNPVDATLRARLLQELRAMDDAQALVIAARGRDFSAFTTLSGDDDAPTLRQLGDALSALPIPVVVALKGRVTGAGASMALRADRIVAASDLRLSFDDAAFALSPGGGASQLLPRRIGVASALDLLLTARAVDADEALALGLVDAVVPREVLQAAISAAETLAGHPRRVLDGPLLLGDVDREAVAAARAALKAGGHPAAEKTVTAVEAAPVLPLLQGLDLETVLRGDLLVRPEVGARRSAAAAARRSAMLPPALARAEARPITGLWLRGGGAPAAALALQALTAGLSVTLYEPDEQRQTDTLEAIALGQDAQVASGHYPPDAREADWARLALANDADPDREARPDMLLIAAAGAAGAGADDADAVIGGGAKGPGLALQPAGHAVEVSMGAAAPEMLVTLVAALRRIGFDPVLVGGPAPVLGQTLRGAMTRAVAPWAAAGLTAADYDAALLRQGLRGTLPFWSALVADGPARAEHQAEAARAVDAFWKGVAAEGVRALAAGLAPAPAAIDHLLAAGQGWPRDWGVPMARADARGLLLFRSDLAALARRGAAWDVPDYLSTLIAGDQGLDALNPDPGGI